MFKPKFRIIYNEYNQYTVQVYKWYFPFWIEAEYGNSFSTIKKAKKYIEFRTNPLMPPYN